MSRALKGVRQALNAIAAVTRKELYSYLVSPMAYVVTAVFLLVNGFIFYVMVSSPGAEASLRPLLPTTAFLLLLIIPVLTMRLLAEEKSTGTIELLMTFPLTDTQVVLGKYLATFLVYLFMLVPTLVYVLVIKVFGNSEWGPLLTAYLGLILLGGTFIAVGMLSSSLARNQIVAGVLGIGLLLMLWVLGAAAGMMGPRLGELVGYLSLTDHFQNFSFGVIDLKDVVFYLSFIAGALFLTVRVVESSRWRV
ncbi:MAG TPA: ABC transporter permease subunit [Chloroflexota bacterium]|nr:ABC transporter permease subunit [Chloroflexota bacterium]